MSEVLKQGLPFLQRFAGLGKYLPKGAIRNNAYAAALFTPLDVAGNFMEGKNPIRAIGRPLFQLGGGIGGGMLGGALGIPSGPGLIATTAAGGTGGYYGGGALFDQAFPERDSHLGKDALRLAALTLPMGGSVLSYLNRPSPAQAKETLSNVKAAQTSPGRWFGLPDLGVTEMFSTKDPSQVRVGDVNFQQAKTRLAGDTDITSGTGMANIPATVPSTGQTHKDYEIQQRQEQGAYIPPGMTTSAGTPVVSQAGSGTSDSSSYFLRGLNPKDTKTLQVFMDQGYDLEGSHVSRHQLRDLARNLRARSPGYNEGGKDPHMSFTGSKGTFYHHKPWRGTSRTIKRK